MYETSNLKTRFFEIKNFSKKQNENEVTSHGGVCFHSQVLSKPRQENHKLKTSLAYITQNKIKKTKSKQKSLS